MLKIDTTSYRAIAFDQRISSLVLHYTELDFDESVRVLTEQRLSAHYLVSETPTVFQLVDEAQRAWHAGISSWQGKSGLNDTSIGIEIVNLGKSAQWPHFGAEQIQMVIALSLEIIARYHIHPTCVVGHSDIAPLRKDDPGPVFPWGHLYQNGVGAWPDQETIAQCRGELVLQDIAALQQKLARYGFGIKITGVLDEETRIILSKFQMHFRPADYSGLVDGETLAILEALLRKYEL